jgi:uncharacterized protein YukE
MRMSEVIADPARLRQLAKTLTQASQELETLARQLQRSLDATGWRGNERARFEQELKQALKTLSLVGVGFKNHYVPDLQKKAEALERFRA